MSGLSGGDDPEIGEGEGSGGNGNVSNKWEQPASPPPPLFLGEKEKNLVKQINDEIIERVVGQSVLYYPIDENTTNFHSLYGEAIEKTFLPPVRVYALVDYQSTETKADTVGGIVAKYMSVTIPAVLASPNPLYNTVLSELTPIL